jgi:hypothetical protein
VEDSAVRKWFLLLVLVGGVGVVAALPDNSEACWRRRCHTVYCYPQGYLPPGPPPGYAPAPQTRSVTIKGKTYHLLPTGDTGEHDKEDLLEKGSPLAKKAGIPSTDQFMGKARLIAKVTIFDGDPKSFDTITALRKQLLAKDDDAMIALNIGKGPDVDRVEQEQANVTVTAYIYAFRKESDNDFHVILGDKPGTTNAKYLNAEVSGIPAVGTDENRQQLWTVRKAFKDAFELGDEGPDAYFRPHQPIPVRVTGSLFYDVEHVPPHTVGPKYASPGTAWEIHPISKIDFLD